MIRSTILMLTALLPLVAATCAEAAAPPGTEMPRATDPAITPPMAAPKDSNPVASALRSKLNALPIDGSAQELKERAVLSDFYAARRDAPMWLSEAGLTDNGAALGAEILKAGDWGLEAKDFALPAIPPAAQLDAEKIGKADVEISLALLKYARFARGGRIIDPPSCSTPISTVSHSSLIRSWSSGRRCAADPRLTCADCTPSNRSSKSCAKLISPQGKAARQEDPRQHGRVALDAGRPGRNAHHRERAGVHGHLVKDGATHS